MTGNRICSIICGAPDGRLETMPQGYIICADRGLDHALAAGITPDLAIGDFDSAKTAVPQGTECIKALPEKDDTDTLLAAKTAIQRGYTTLEFYCALGGRADHTIANLQMLEYLRLCGVKARLHGGNTCIYLLEGEAEIPRFEGYLSVFAFGGDAVISGAGVKYPTDRLRITESFPIGVSNEITADFAKITAHEGRVLIVEIHEKD
ncbi:MAG: thiamine diphosphokinase [Oscillospiraceae bacterium]